MNMEIMLRSLSDEDLEQLRRLVREEQQTRVRRKQITEELADMIRNAKEVYGIDMISKETGEVLDEVPFYFY